MYSDFNMYTVGKIIVPICRAIMKSKYTDWFLTNIKHYKRDTIIIKLFSLYIYIYYIMLTLTPSCYCCCYCFCSNKNISTQEDEAFYPSSNSHTK